MALWHCVAFPPRRTWWCCELYSFTIVCHLHIAWNSWDLWMIRPKPHSFRCNVFVVHLHSKKLHFYEVYTATWSESSISVNFSASRPRCFRWQKSRHPPWIQRHGRHNSWNWPTDADWVPLAIRLFNRHFWLEVVHLLEDVTWYMKMEDAWRCTIHGLNETSCELWK